MVRLDTLVVDNTGTLTDGKPRVTAVVQRQATLVKGDLTGIARARALSRATMRNIRQNLTPAFVYNVAGVPVVLAMTLRPVSVIGNALRLRSVRL